MSLGDLREQPCRRSLPVLAQQISIGGGIDGRFKGEAFLYAALEFGGKRKRRLLFCWARRGLSGQTSRRDCSDLFDEFLDGLRVAFCLCCSQARCQSTERVYGGVFG